MSYKGRREKIQNSAIPTYSAFLKDGIKVNVREVNRNDMSELAAVTKICFEEVAKMQGNLIDALSPEIKESAKKTLEVDDFSKVKKAILDLMEKNSLNMLILGQHEVIIAEKKGEIIGVAENTSQIGAPEGIDPKLAFLFSSGVVQKDSELRENFARKDPELAREGFRILTIAKTVKYHRKGVNRCLLLYTLLKRPETKFYLLITTEHAEGMVKMVSQIADKAEMNIKIREEDVGKAKHYTVDLYKTKNTNLLLQQILQRDYAFTRVKD